MKSYKFMATHYQEWRSCAANTLAVKNDQYFFDVNAMMFS